MSADHVVANGSDFSSIVLSALGISCLDHIVQIPNSNLLDKYALPYDGQAVIYPDLFEDLQNDIREGNYEVTKCTGGCSLNTLRIFQWLIRTPNKTVMFGVVGRDEEMRIVKKQVENDGVITKFLEVENGRTRCIVILTMQNMRCCVGKIETIPTEVVDYPSDSDRQIIANSTFLHTDGFLLIDKTEIVLRAIQTLGSNSFSFNLGAVFLIQKLPHLFWSVSKMCDILFANKDEFETLIELNNLRADTFVQSILNVQRAMISYYSEQCVEENIPNRHISNNSIIKKWKKIVVVTDGCNGVHCVFGNGELIVHDTVQIEDDAIVDTTGAGDSFIAGFLYGLVHDFDIRKCLHIACNVAGEIIRQPGVFIPNKSPVEIMK